MEYILIGGAVSAVATAGIKKIREHNQKQRHREFISELIQQPTHMSGDSVPVVSGSSGLIRYHQPPLPSLLHPEPPLMMISNGFTMVPSVIPDVRIEGIPSSNNYFVVEPIEPTVSPHSMGMIQAAEPRMLLTNEPYTSSNTSLVTTTVYRPQPDFNDQVIESQNIQQSVYHRQMIRDQMIREQQQDMMRQQQQQRDMMRQQMYQQPLRGPMQPSYYHPAPHRDTSFAAMHAEYSPDNIRSSFSSSENPYYN